MFLIRLLIVGETGVGKTSLLLRFHEDQFVVNQKTTIGVDYKAKEVQINNEPIKLQIWDTAGQERFRSMTSAFYSKAQGVVVAFDVTQRSTFESLSSWIRDVRENTSESCCILLCANKIDMHLDHWQVRRDEFQSFAASTGCTLIECSASSGDNVREIFMELGKQVLDSSRAKLTEVDEDKENGNSIILADFLKRNKKRGKKSNCCTIS